MIFQPGNKIQTIALSSGSDPEPGQIVTATGWGVPSENSEFMSDVLREVDVPIMSNDDCNNVYGLIADGHICTNSAGGKGTCYVRKNPTKLDPLETNSHNY